MCAVIWPCLSYLALTALCVRRLMSTAAGQIDLTTFVLLVGSGVQLERNKEEGEQTKKRCTRRDRAFQHE